MKIEACFHSVTQSVQWCKVSPVAELLSVCPSPLSTARSVSVRPARAPTSASSGGPSCRRSSWWPSASGRWDTSRASSRPRNWCKLSPGGESESVCVCVSVRECVRERVCARLVSTDWCSAEQRRQLSEEKLLRIWDAEKSRKQHLYIIIVIITEVLTVLLTSPVCNEPLTFAVDRQGNMWQLYLLHWYNTVRTKLSASTSR